MRTFISRKRSGVKRVPDLRIIITEKVIILECPKTKTDGFIAKKDPRAIKILDFIRT